MYIVLDSLYRGTHPVALSREKLVWSIIYWAALREVWNFHVPNNTKENVQRLCLRSISPFIYIYFS